MNKIETKQGQSLVSIITPSYNQGQFIERTILSIKNQNYSNIEHIIMDGGSTDETIDIIKKYEKSYNLRWVSEPDKGQSDALNKGLKMAQGEIIGWINSDDTYFTKDVIDKVMNEFHKNNDIDIIHGNRLIIDDFDNLLRLQYSRIFSYDKFLKGYCTIFSQSVFIQKRVIYNYKFDINFRFAMDTKLLLDIAKSCKSMFLNDFLGCFRLQPNSKTVLNENINTWNKERKHLVNEYNDYIINNTGSLLDNLLFKIKRLSSGSNNNYIFLLKDIIKILSYSKSIFAFPINLNSTKFLSYISNSLGLIPI